VWAHLLSFLGGGHNCIGYRFSLAEMKALLFVLLRAFEFELAVPGGCRRDAYAGAAPDTPQRAGKESASDARASDFELTD
jgi:cytochrome P450